MRTAIAQLAEAGFDIAHPFDTDAVSTDPGLMILAGAHRFGLLLGNTRMLWPPFVAAMRDPELAAHPDPLERYTERTIDAAFPGARIYYGHRCYADGFLPFQRLAVTTGLGALAPSHLVIHPTYGSWFALRAVVVLPGSPPPRSLPVVRACQCAAPCRDSLANAVAARPTWQAWLAVRDACPLRTWRYSEDQIRYHYQRVWTPLDGHPVGGDATP